MTCDKCDRPGTHLLDGGVVCLEHWNLQRQHEHFARLGQTPPDEVV